MQKKLTKWERWQRKKNTDTTRASVPYHKRMGSMPKGTLVQPRLTTTKFDRKFLNKHYGVGVVVKEYDSEVEVYWQASKRTMKMGKSGLEKARRLVVEKVVIPDA